MTDDGPVPGLDLPALRRVLDDRLPRPLQGPLRAELVAGGRSNLTYLLSDDVGRWVLRRPPLGHVLATAHDMAREHRLLTALHPTAVPVPRPLLLAGDDVLGAPFYVMEFAEGVVLRERAQLEALAPEEAQRVAESLIDVLGELHRVDPVAVGLGDLGRPDGYLERQLVRWARQLESSRSRELPELAALGHRLASAVPRSQRTGVVHGDYRLDNVVLDLPAGRVTAVLDWEMATLGDPLADAASTLLWWDGMRGLDSPVAAVPGDVATFPPGDALLARYAAATGLDLSPLPWYLAFAGYKVAAIFEGIHYRHEQGLTVGEGFDRLGALVPPLVERAHAVLDETPGR